VHPLLLPILLSLLTLPLPVHGGSILDPELIWDQYGLYDGDEYGYAVAGAGDVDGDGWDDFLVGAPGYYVDLLRQGSVWLYRGSPGSFDPIPVWTTAGGEQGSRYGAALSTAGDVDGDGYADILVGAPHFGRAPENVSQEGRAYLYLGSHQGLATSPAWTFGGGQQSAHLGYSVASAGDIDADGFADVIVGARLYSDTLNNEGAAFVFHGSDSDAGLPTAPNLVLAGGAVGATFGHAVASAGDVNDDGYDDVLVGAPQYPVGGIAVGAAFLFLGSDAGLVADPAWTFFGEQADARFGTSVAAAGDLNHDGFDDVVVGAPLYDDVVENVGAVFVFLGSAQGLGATPDQIIATGGANANLGHDIAPLGDVSGDGRDDIIVGAPRLTNDQPEEGSVLIFGGTSAGLLPTPLWQVYGEKAETLFGQAVAGVGHIQGDGSPGFAIGAPAYFKFEKTKVGRAYLYQVSPDELPIRAHIPIVLK
jgi:hypothetical protein